MAPTAKILGKVKRSVEKVAYGNPLYHKILTAGQTPDRLTFTPPDLWPGDAHAGMTLMANEASMFDGAPAPETTVVSATASASTLRNLRAVGTDAAQATAVALIYAGMTRCASWNQTEWEPAALGARIAAWIGFYDFYAEAAPQGFIQPLAENLHRQWKHLLRTLPASAENLAGMNVTRGLIYGALNFAKDEQELTRILGHACDMLRRQLAAEIMPDGTHQMRNPSVHMRMLQYLVELRALFTLAGLPWPEETAMAITTMTPVLKFYRHGDGGLALFHGGREESALMIDATLTHAEIKSRMPRRLTHGKVERITAGRSWLVADGGAPPFGPHWGGHAGLASFEFGQGKERIIVNGGGYEDNPCRSAEHNAAWKCAMAATAAHSTLTLQDTNAADLDKAGSVAGAVPCSANRFECDGEEGLELSHEGYVRPYGFLHQRTLSLTKDGEILRGRDTLENILIADGNRNTALDYTLRWHLHPTVNAALAQNGQTALLKTASGAGWRLRVEGVDLMLEPSIYCGMGAPRRTLQLKATGLALAPRTLITWSLTREKK